MKRLIENRVMAGRSKYNMRKLIKDLEHESQDARNAIVPHALAIIDALGAIIMEPQEHEQMKADLKQMITKESDK